MTKYFNWQQELLKGLPVKQFGRSYDEKFKKAAKAAGVKDVTGFRNFLDNTSRETPKRVTKNEGYSAEYWDEYSQQLHPSPKTTVKAESRSKMEDKKPKTGLLNDILTPLKRYGEGVKNVFDGDPNTTFTDAFKNAVNDAKSTDRSKVTKELTRGLTRTANSALLGALDETYKKTHAGESAVQFQSRKGAGKAADFAYDALGLFAPGAAAYKGAKALKLGAKAGTKGIAKAGQLAKEGAAAGALFGAGQVGVREAINGKDYSAKENARDIALNTLLGGVADPLLVGGNQLLKGASEKAIKKLLPDSKDLGKRLGDAYMTGEKSDLPTSKPIHGSLQDRLRALSPNRKLPDFSNAKPVIDNPNENIIAKHYGIDVPAKPRDLVEEAPREYWQKRYEDFAKYVHQNYDTNKITKEGLDELWTHFAKPDEPVNLEQLAELAYKDYKPSKVIDTNEVWSKFGNRKPVSNNALKKMGISRLQEPKGNQPDLLRSLRVSPIKNEVASAAEKITPQVENGGVLKRVPQSDSELIQQIANDTGKITELPKVINPKVAEKPQLESQLQLLRDNLKKATTKKEKDAIRKDILDVRKGLDVIKQKNLLESDITFDDLLANADNWKDKASPLLKRETMYRNFEDIAKEDSDVLKKTLLDPIGREEANSVKFKNQERDNVRKFKIKGNSKDSALAQMYGEGKITLDELKSETKNWQNVVSLTEHLRQRYDEILPAMNKVLKEHGFPEVPYRKNYFPHMEDLKPFQKFLKDHVGIDFEDHTLPTDINGLTSQFKPGKQFFRNSLQRKGDQTAYDAIVGFDKYLEGVSNVIYHTKNIKRLRAFEGALRKKFKDTKHLANFASELEQFTNMLAGKKVGFDHTVEKYTGRKIYTFVDNMRKRTGSNMLAFNVSSSLTNLIPALTQAPALTGKKYFIKGMMDTLSNVIKKDGFETDFLTRREGSDPLYRDLWGKVTDKGFWFMKVMDKFASQTIVRSKYYELIDKGLSEKAAKKQADEFAAKIMADRSKGSMPTLFADKTLGLVTQFQLEVNNQISLMFKDIPKMSKNKAAMASAYAQVFLYSYFFNNLFEKMTGRRPAFDPVGVALNAKEDYNNKNISKGEAAFRTIENVANQLPFLSTVTGGRYPIEAGFPQVFDVMQGKSSWSKELAKPATYLLPPTGGGAGKKVYQTLTDFGKNPLSDQKDKGVYNKNKLMFPIKGDNKQAVQELLFGRSALPETRAYYDNKRTSLSEGQTKAYQRLNQVGSGKDLYNILRVDKNIKSSDKAKITRIENDEKLSDTEKLQKMLDLLRNLKK